MQKYDVVVIGAGNAGISAACKMALSGKKTLLLEKHNIPGGCATSFKRGRFEFEASLHELCDFGSESNQGEVRKLLVGEYGLDIEWLEVPDTFRVISQDRNGKKLDVTMPVGRRAFIDKMEFYVPGCLDAMEDFFELVDEIMDALGYIGSSNGKTDPNYMRKQFPNFLRTAAYSTDKVLKAIKMPLQAADILKTYWSYLGIDCKRLSFVHYAAMVHKYVHKSAYIPKLTSHGLSIALVDRFIKLGGEVWFNTKADEILFDGDKVSGIKTSQGVISTEHIICNANPHVVYANMIPKDLIPEREIKLANARKHSSRAYVLYLGLNKSPEELGINDYSYFILENMDTEDAYKSMGRIETNNYNIALCYNIVNPDISEKGTTVMSFTKIYSEDVWKDIGIEDYVDVKNRIAKETIEAFEEKTGIKIKDSIEEFSVATPWTFARYLGTPEGSIYGYETNEWDGMMARLMMVKEDYPIKGLRFAGGFGPRAHGYSASYLCGDLMARLTLKDMAAVGVN